MPSLTIIICIFIKKLSYLRELKIFGPLKTGPTLACIASRIKINIIEVTIVIDGMVLMEGYGLLLG